jgi:pimeloyl-ACP methyl ester carboxylesterase
MYTSGLRWLAAILAAALVSAGCGKRQFRAEMERARARLAEGKQFVCPLGSMEYARRGAGPTLLIVHGAGGGFDQGLAFGEMLDDSLHILAVSRFGYCGTPMPDAADIALQADLYAALLDSLEIDKAFVMGISAGGPSAMRFALRHPGRCSGLILSCALSVPPERPQRLGLIFRYLFSSSYRYWRLTSRSRERTLRIFGTSSEVIEAMNSGEKRWVDSFFASMHPMRLRYAGIKHEGRLFWSKKPWPVEAITAPTILFHAQDDKLVDCAQSRATARRIPGARLIEFETGGHLLLGAHERIRRELSAFIADARAQ